MTRDRVLSRGEGLGVGLRWMRTGGRASFVGGRQRSRMCVCGQGSCAGSGVRVEGALLPSTPTSALN